MRGGEISFALDPRLRALGFIAGVPITILAIGITNRIMPSSIGVGIGTSSLVVAALMFGARQGESGRALFVFLSATSVGLLVVAIHAVLVSGAVALTGIVALLLLAASEELVFRVVGPRIIAAAFPHLGSVAELLGVLIAQLLFAICHFIPECSADHITFATFARFFAAGIFFSFAVEYCGLGAAIGLHATVNRELVSGVAHTNSPPGIVSVALIVFAFAMVAARRARIARGRAHTPFKQWETPWITTTCAIDGHSALSQLH